MKNNEDFSKIAVYLDRKFRGMNIYKVIGFLEHFKQVLLEEIEENESN